MMHNFPRSPVAMLGSPLAPSPAAPCLHDRACLQPRKGPRLTKPRSSVAAARAGLCVCLLQVLLGSASARAASQKLTLSPPQSAVEIRAYGFGLLPLDGQFTRFSGALQFDPNDSARCHATLRADTISLTMANATIRQDILGPEFLDTAQFPELRYRGDCGPDGLDGMLTLHGVTRRFRLELRRDEQQLVATGRLRRADWGMSARQLFGGSTVRIRITTPLQAQ